MRLTKSLREDICRDALKKAPITKLISNLKSEIYDFSDEFRIHLLGGKEAERKLNAFIKRVNKQIKSSGITAVALDVCTRSYMTIKYGNEVHSLYFAPGERNERNYLEYPQRIVHSYKVVNLAEHPAWEKVFGKLQRRLEDAEKQQNDLRTDINASLNSVTTVKKLLDVWPEAAELIPEKVSAATNLPAIPVISLNQAIGLPSKVAA